LEPHNHFLWSRLGMNSGEGAGAQTLRTWEGQPDPGDELARAAGTVVESEVASGSTSRIATKGVTDEICAGNEYAVFAVTTARVHGLAGVCWLESP
jgi:hypothetical protein